MLRAETQKTLGHWLFGDVVCRWGRLFEIVSDNRPHFVKVLEYLSRQYHITHIWILGYNSHSNGLIEQSNFDVRQALFQSVDRDQAKWSKGTYFGLIVSPFVTAWAVPLTLQLSVRIHCSLWTSPKQRIFCHHPWHPS